MPVAPPPPRLPPLPHLAAFEAAVRLGGYAAAAGEMGVTAGAVRVKVRALEGALGVTLFRPLPQGVMPTAEARDLAEGVARGLAALVRALAPLGDLPLPLGALRVFEAALKAGGFATAGEALGLSPGAVAAQVRRVEDWAGRPLFTRHARGVTPLAEPLAVLPGLSRALSRFDALAIGAATVRIAALPAVAQLWLMPRLPALRAALPGVAVSVTALERPPEAKRAPYDLAIFFAESGGRLLAEDALIPVCAPALAPGLRMPADLARLPCLGDSTWSGDWRHWASVVMPGRPVPRGVDHSLYALAVAEAMAGAGVLMGHTALLAGALADGRLVAPLGPAVPVPRGLRLTRLRPLPRGGAAARVADWLAEPGLTP
ncbi:LysR family transcriptional regulator [Pararhodobacter sp.]|uniref:LysR family transcriptional regulator n=1 Tax=Pararhodobacter sp. TaxID=2127056 RepID=UPI002FE06284